MDLTVQIKSKTLFIFVKEYQRLYD